MSTTGTIKRFWPARVADIIVYPHDSSHDIFLKLQVHSVCTSNRLILKPLIPFALKRPVSITDLQCACSHAWCSGSAVPLAGDQKICHEHIYYCRNGRSNSIATLADVVMRICFVRIPSSVEPRTQLVSSRWKERDCTSPAACSNVT